MPDLSFERECGYPSQWVMGVDEVGRGCLAGPVVAGAVMFPLHDGEFPAWFQQIDDSKKLTAGAREMLDREIRGWTPYFGIGMASVEEIDQINIYHAAHLAMKRAIAECHKLWRSVVTAQSAFSILIDGNAAPKGLSGRVRTIVKGDSKSLSIASASILAKVQRDSLMLELSGKFPGYGFEQHKGYATPQHQAAIGKLGVTAIHRRTFEPIKSMLGRSVSAQGSLL